MKKVRKGFKFGWCASQNHDWCPHHLTTPSGSATCTCWCHPKEEEVAA